MHVRFVAAERAELAIASSRLDEAHASARVISELPEPEALPVWRLYIADVQSAAHEVELATDILGAAHAVGTLGRECARCHVASKARVKFPSLARPAVDSKLGPQMLGHQWAATEMWRGLIGPSDEHWNAGTEALSTMPIDTVAMVTPGDVDDVARVRLLARRARATPSNESRARVFGDLLAACASCHTTLRDR